MGVLLPLMLWVAKKKLQKKIIDSGGDYVIGVKKNQPTLYNEVVKCMDEALEQREKEKSIDYYETVESGHGRKEIRRYYILDEIDTVESSINWKGLNTIGMVESVRTNNGKTTKNKRYYISSIDKNASYWGLVSEHIGV